ncbi:ABC transporter permease [Virgibacillus sp. MSJ-26]|uniref:ABC transporter permease n=1 Tax=Virgibacillus sp. MSJ-26 TaxID=2841522 RepID=UPI001C11D435|nr:ABC transporter permease [Virgibacillus sp. MSJ-26]MBU5466574.1 ABC transporter permease [Virgibacillus sp. MSJ-26]
MKNTILTRFIHLKKHWLSFIFWLILPLIGTITIIQIADELGEDSKIPVGMVLEESTRQSLTLYKSIQDNSLLAVEKLNEDEALKKLEKHELDSVFIIKKGYEESIRQGNRNRLVTSYHSNLSFAYTTVKEMIVSLIQQDTGRSKTAYIVNDLSEEYYQKDKWTWDEIVKTSEIVQEEENLLKNSFSYSDINQTNERPTDALLNPWGIWAVLSVLCSLFIFDWVVKERTASTRQRFFFLNISHHRYLLRNLVIYTIILFLVDIVSFMMINQVYTAKNINFILTLLSFKLMILLGSFLVALCFRKLFNYYSFSVALTLIIAIMSGAIFPIKDITSFYQNFTWLNPFHAFLAEEITMIWTIILTAFTIVWYFRKENDRNA